MTHTHFLRALKKQKYGALEKAGTKILINMQKKVIPFFIA